MLSDSRSLISIPNSLRYTGIGKEVHTKKAGASSEFVLQVWDLYEENHWERLVWTVWIVKAGK